MKRRLLFFLGMGWALMFIAASQSLQASSAILVSREDLVLSADAVLQGRVEWIGSASDPSGDVDTLVAVRVSRDLLHGFADGALAYLREPGGRYQGISGWVVGAPEFYVGEEVLVFASLRQDGYLETAHLFQGKFSMDAGGTLKSEVPANTTILGGTATARFLSMDEVEEAITQSAGRLRDVTRAMQLAFDERAFEPMLELSLRALAGTTALSLKDGVGEGTSFFTLEAGGVRWRQFDSSLSVPFYVNTANAPVSASTAISTVDNVVQAWDGIVGTRILLANGGTTGLSGRNFNDGANVISFGDPQGIIPDPSGCSGTLAVTYFQFFTNTSHAVNGVDFRELLQADIVFNNGFNCFLGIPSNLAEVGGHEMGHAIGLGHSSENGSEPNPILSDALMYYLAHGDGRGASIRVDDALGAQFIYPGPLLPGPTLASLSPGSRYSGAAAFTLSVTGSNFDALSTVRWNGSDRSTTFVNSGLVRASISAADVATAGSAAVTVFKLGAGSSNSLTFTIDANPLTDTSAFVRQQYLDFLNRQPDSGGLSYWSSQIDSGALSSAQVVYEFFRSGEFQDNGGYIGRLYAGILFRRADFGGFTYWLGQLNSGARSKEQIIDQFIASPEFQSRFGGNLSHQEFVRLLYLNILGREPDADGSGYWTGQLSSGAQTRAQVTRSFVESPEFVASTDASIFVQLTYLGMLRRAADDGGFSFWIGQFNGGRSRLDLISQFLASSEYRNRFL